MATTYLITTTLELPDDPRTWQVQDLEKMILEKTRQAMRESLSKMLLDYEKAFLKEHKHWDRKERWSKEISTLFGSLRLERYRVWDRQEKKSRYPLDEALSIPKWRKETHSYQQAVISQTVQRSFRQSQQEIGIQTGVEASLMGVWSLTQRLASEQRESEKAPLPWKSLLLPDPPLPGQPDPCPALGIDLDDTYCRSWKTKKWFKDHGVRVAVLYRHKVPQGKKWMLLDKKVVVSGPGESLTNFLDRVTQLAVTHYGLHCRTKVVVHGDGDPMIRNYAIDYLPDALYRLDPWHVKKKLREATGLKQLPEEWQSKIYGYPDDLISDLAVFQKQIAPEDASYQKLSDLIGYLKNNREGLLPSGVSREEKDRFPRLYKRGSGTIERNVDWTVGARCKQSRMSWSQKGLDNILFLREKHLNNYQPQRFEPVPGSHPEFLGIN